MRGPRVRKAATFGMVALLTLAGCSGLFGSDEPQTAGPPPKPPPPAEGPVTALSEMSARDLENCLLAGAEEPLPLPPGATGKQLVDKIAFEVEQARELKF